MSETVTFVVNGTEVRLDVDPRMTLADVLRSRLGLTGTHLGCEHGVCGACTVLIDGRAVRSCLTFAVQVEGDEILTVEGLGTPDDLHPLQRSFGEHHGLQCGFCTPGFLLSAYELLRDGAAEVEGVEDAADALSGVLCRCTGYRGILAAVLDTARRYPDGLPPPRNLGAPVGVAAPPAQPIREAQPGLVPEPTRGADVDLSVPEGEPSATVQVTTTVQAAVDEVWALVSDIPRVSRCLPGAELTGQTPTGDHLGRVNVRVGPMRFRFDGVARIIEQDDTQHTLQLVGAGADPRGGSARAHMTFAAHPAEAEGTLLRADARLFLTGRAAQFGRSIMDDVSRQLFEEFAQNVEVTLQTGEAAPSRRLGAGRLLWRALVARMKAWWQRRTRSRGH